jgi:hypothetical protein
MRDFDGGHRPVIEICGKKPAMNEASIFELKFPDETRISEIASLLLTAASPWLAIVTG